MSDTTTDRVPETDTKRDLVAEFDELRERIHARNPDMTPEDWDELAERWAEEVNARIRARIERGEPV
jgi:deoxyadenosine/deoxycytidine kinase